MRNIIHATSNKKKLYRWILKRVVLVPNLVWFCFKMKSREVIGFSCRLKYIYRMKLNKSIKLNSV
ncbi:hypothetical protein YC2023_037145 [Brassica napus]